MSKLPDLSSLATLDKNKLIALATLKARGLDIALFLTEINLLVKADSKATQFTQQYFNDPVAFVHDCFIWKADESPTDYQIEIIGNLPEKKRESVRGPHGLGKTALNSWLILWFALTRDAAEVDWKAPITAGAWRQLSKFLFPEVHKWSKRLRWNKIGREPFHPVFELQQLSLKLNYGEAFAVASDNPDLIEGAHAEQLFYVFDESKAIPEKTFDAAEGAFSNTGANDRTEALALSASTPGEPFGRFYDIQSRKPGFEDWWVRYVTFDEVVKANRATWQWANQRKVQWGETSALYQNKVLGKFASQDAQGVIPLAWVEAANERWKDLEESGKLKELRESHTLTAVGVDVGDGGDETVIARRLEQVILEINHLPRLDLMSTVGRVKGIAQANGGSLVVDVIGIGAGVVSRLRELQSEARTSVIIGDNPADSKRFEVVPFHAANASTERDSSGEMGFLNKRAEAWWKMRERLDPANNSTVALPPDDKLTGDLVAPQYKVNSRGLYQIESKDDIRKRLGRSTDTADAVIMAFEPVITTPRIRRL